MDRIGAIAIGGGIAVAAVAISAAIVVTRGRVEVAPEPKVIHATPAAVATPKAAEPEPPKLTPAEELAVQVRAAKTLAETIAAAKPFMRDEFGETSLGTHAMATWSAEHLAWTDVAVAKDETSYALARKDIDRERGKRVCVPGRLIEIAAAKVEPRYYTGLMQSSLGNLFHFYAVRDTDDLVGGDIARFCGVVTGLFSYRNSGGGVGHAVEVVGMFDLPSNRK